MVTIIKVDSAGDITRYNTTGYIISVTARRKLQSVDILFFHSGIAVEDSLQRRLVPAFLLQSRAGLTMAGTPLMLSVGLIGKNPETHCAGLHVTRTLPCPWILLGRHKACRLSGPASIPTSVSQLLRPHRIHFQFNAE